MSPRRQPKKQKAAPSGDGEIRKAAAVLQGAGNLSAIAWVIRAGKSPYGPRPRWGQIEYAQTAICELHPHGLPENFNGLQLAEDVKEQLARDPNYCAVGFKPISRQTVLRAVKLLREANRSD